MSEFKGTKGKWVFDDVQIFSINGEETTPARMIANNHSPYSEYRSEWEANALLISKAPEMLEMLERVVALEDIICMGGAVGEQWVGEAQALEEMMDKIKQLIKSATEL